MNHKELSRTGPVRKNTGNSASGFRGATGPWRGNILDVKNLSCLTESNPSLFLPRGVLELLSSGHFSQWCWEEDASWMAEGRVGMKEPFATAVHECLELPWQRGLDPWCQITAQLLNRIELSAACSLTLGTWMMSPPSVFIEWTLYCWALPWLSFCQLRTWGQ